MATLSITQAWNETAEFAKRDFGALFTVALAFNALPSVAFQALAPAAAAPGQMPSSGLWLLFGFLLIVLSIVGALAISTLALGRERVVGRAIAHGFRRFLPMFGASALLAVAFLFLMLPLLFAAGVRPDELAQPTPELLARLSLVMLALFVLLVALWTRLMLMTPVAAAETGGPLRIIARSWRLTSGRFWKLLGFVLLVIVAVLVIMAVVSIVAGLLVTLVAGRPDPGSTAALLLLLVSGLANAAFVALFTTMVARIYAQLAAGEAAPTTGS